MPIENEIKFVLDDPYSHLESFLFKNLTVQDIPGLHGYDVLQGYLDRDTRIRIFREISLTGEFAFTKKNSMKEEILETDKLVFSFKRRVAETQIEIEIAMTVKDIIALLPTVELFVRKRRYKFHDNNVDWDVDFLKNRKAETYFTIAEAEMPEKIIKPKVIPSFINEQILLNVGRESGFGNRRLADETYVRKALKSLRTYVSNKKTTPSYDCLHSIENIELEVFSMKM